MKLHFKFLNSQIIKFLNLYIFKYSKTNYFKSLNIEISKSLNLYIFKYSFPVLVFACLLAPISARAYFALGVSTILPTLNSGLVGYWDMNAQSVNWATNEITDSSGSGNTGQLISMSTTTSPTAGKIGGALIFNGATSKITVANTIAGVQSISFWTKSPQTASIIDLDGSASISISAGTISATNFTSPTIYIDGVVSSTLPDNKWHNITITTGSAISASAIKLGVIGSTFFNGNIDDVRVYNRALTATEIKQLYHIGQVTLGVSNPQFLNTQNSLVGHWTMDAGKVNWTTNQMVDSSGNSNTGQLVAMSTTTSPVPGKIGGAMKFNGSSQYVTISDSSSLKPTQISFGGWVNKTSRTANSVPIGKITLGTNGYMIYAEDASDFTMKCFIYGLTPNQVVFPGNAPLGSWNHYMCTYDGATIKGYRNGVLVVSTSVTGSISHSTVSLQIGKYSTNPQYFSGLLDDVRIYNRALSATEIKQLYNSGKVTVGASAPQFMNNGLVGYWSMGANDVTWTTNIMKDLSGQGNSGQLVAMSTTTSPVAGKTGGAMRFDGVNDYVNVGDIASLDFGVGQDFAISFWYKINSTSGGPPIFKRQESGGNEGYQFTYAGTFVIDATAGQIALTPSPTLTIGVWHHLVGLRNGTTAQLFIDGVLNGSTTNVIVDDSLTTAQPLWFGRHLDSWTSPDYLSGSIDQVRIYNRALSATEVKQLYNSGQ